MRLTVELSARELRGIRGAVLEAWTDQVFSAQPEQASRARQLLDELSDAAATTSDATVSTTRLDAVSATVVARALIHVTLSDDLYEWELPIRVGLTKPELDELQLRLTGSGQGPGRLPSG